LTLTIAVRRVMSSPSRFEWMCQSGDSSPVVLVDRFPRGLAGQSFLQADVPELVHPAHLAENFPSTPVREELK
jgi:hypothetical protein